MNNQKKLFRHFRTTALILVFSLTAILAFQTIHAGHEECCQEENCPVCLLLQVIHNTNKIVNTPPLTSIEFSIYSYINLFIFSALFFVPATLVEQKVKLVI